MWVCVEGVEIKCGGAGVVWGWGVENTCGGAGVVWGAEKEIVWDCVVWMCAGVIENECGSIGLP